MMTVGAKRLTGIEAVDCMKFCIPRRVLQIRPDFFSRMPREYQLQLLHLRVKLNAEAVAQIESSDTRRVEMLNDLKGHTQLHKQSLGQRLRRLTRAGRIRRKLFECGGQIAVLVQVADQELGCFPQLRVQA